MSPAGLEPLSKKGEREETKMVLLMRGWDNRLLSAKRDSSAVPSDIDTSTWRNRVSLRVRSIRAQTRMPSIDNS